MSIQKRGTGYTVRWRDSAGVQHSQQVRLWRDALTLDGEMKRKRAMGELIAHEKGKITLDEFWRIWWNHHAQINLTTRSRDTYARLYGKHVKPVMGHLMLRDVDRETVARLLARCMQTLAPSSSRKVLALLQSVIERAVEWGYVTMNPVKGVRKPKLVQRRGRALTEDQVGALRKELDLRSSTIVAVLAGTGLRPGELRALHWEDNRSAYGLIVDGAVSNDVIGPTKTNRRRQIIGPLRAVQAALTEWYVASGQPGPTDLIFPGANGRVWTDQGWRMWQRQVFKPAAERAGLAGVVPYDLRHTFASQRIAEGADIITLASQLGHSPTMTLTVYGHLLGQVGARDVRESTAQVSNLQARPRI